MATMVLRGLICSQTFDALSNTGDEKTNHHTDDQAHQPVPHVRHAVELHQDGAVIDSEGNWFEFQK